MKAFLAALAKFVISVFVLLMMAGALMLLCAGCAAPPNQVETPLNISARNDTLFVLVAGHGHETARMFAIPPSWRNCTPHRRPR